MSLIAQAAQSESSNRRLYSRGTMGPVMLVFFGLGKWGKLLNISEGGMAFEFYQLPPSGQRISFGLAAMGREPFQPSGELATDSIHADGQLVWARDFERCAGVQFIDLSGSARQQIRQWLSIEPSPSEAETGQPYAIEREPPPPPRTLHDTTSQVIDEAQPWKPELAQSNNPTVPWGPGVTDQATLEAPPGAKSHIDRAALMNMARWLAVLAMLGVMTTLILSQRVRLAALFQIRGRSTGSSAPPRSGDGSIAKNPLVFQVEVVDADNRRRLLTFDKNAPAVDAPLYSSAAPPRTASTPFSFSDTAPRAERSAAEKRRSFSNLRLGGPTVTRAATNPSTEDPMPAIDLGASSKGAIRAADPSREILPNTTQQFSVAPPIPVGGNVQQARLISSVTPAYPAAVRSMGIFGDVTIDALIDSTGKVTTMKPLSGPAPLQQAAMDALRQWEYEPARLNGQPVSTHLSVTVKFQLK